MSDPISEAFERFIGELYWTETLEEAEEKLEDFMRNMDEDLREALLARRREVCSNRELVARTGLALHTLAIDRRALRSLPGDLGVRAAVVAAIVNALFLVQCTPSWSSLDPRVKAGILAPLYRASYALRLAARGKGDARRLVDEALEMVSIALDRISAEGLIDEMEDLAPATG
ncbi:MAG: hypothetical protein GSR80_001439 [Desulfurococcales archaeon]|nr:hypothetical protein [Desulfurococcales archaeon]